MHHPAPGWLDHGGQGATQAIEHRQHRTPRSREGDRKEKPRTADVITASNLDIDLANAQDSTIFRASSSPPRFPISIRSWTSLGG